MTAANETRQAILHVVRDEQEAPMMRPMDRTESPKPKKKRVRKAKKKTNSAQPYGLPPQPQRYITYPDHDFF